ncbi:type I polyketide synthase [Streptosporangium sandarakinum]
MESRCEPIAVIGMGCRFASGIDTPDSLWRFLIERGDASGTAPEGRWSPYYRISPENSAVLRATTARGSFIPDIAGFDAEFFGISPREARLMDPQQRMTLEVAWEALEHAGIPPHSLAGSDTGVFTGVSADDYGRRLLSDLPRIEAWTGIGAAPCGVANRVSHSLDLRGPSVAVDTACSASLVAIHQACQSLRLGEIPLALAGGVMLMAGPELSVVLDAAGAISPDGRSRAFDAAATGYGRGEGCGVVVLKLLRDAVADRDRVLALIIGSAVLQDGRTPGIMAPSREAQEHLLRRAYRAAGVDPAGVGYVEAHGTGTRVGDPVEAGALAAVLGAGRPAGRPCLIGSLKPNIGHLEAASGVAGLIKAVLCLGHGLIPPTPTTAGPTPAIPWESSGLRLVTETTGWPGTGSPRRAGVSGFGYGGTIAHLVLQEAPPAPAPAPAPADDADDADDAVVRPYPLSGATDEALRANAARLADRLSEREDPPLAAVASTLARRRTHLARRAVVVAAGRAELVERLRSLAAGDPAAVTGHAAPEPVRSAPATGHAAPESVRPAPATGRTAPESVRPGPYADAGPVRRDPVWVFSGHGAQWAGMGADLLADEPAFAAALERLEPVYREELGFSPADALRAADLGGTDRVQALTYALQAGLAAVWRSYGVRPGAVIGHSVGEIAAAVAAGVLTESDGARLACRRSRLLRRVAGAGAMVMVGLSPEETAALLAGDGAGDGARGGDGSGDRDGDRAGDGELCAAVWASPYSTVVAGDREAVERAARRWRARGIAVREVASDVAFHSRHMDPLRADLAAAVKDLPAGPARVPLYTTALADPRDPAERDAAYWARNLRDPVRFAAAVGAAAEDGHRAFLEVSAHPVVSHSIGEVLDAAGVTGAVVTHSLRRGRPGRRALLGGLADLHGGGVPVDWPALCPGDDLVDLPRYAWRHRTHWVGDPPAAAGGPGHDPDRHTLLGGRETVHGTSPAYLWRTRLRHGNRPYPGEHPVRGTEVVPAAVLLNTLFTAAGEVFGGTPALAGVSLRVPLSPAAPREVQVVCQDGTLRLSSRLLRDPAGPPAGTNGLHPGMNGSPPGMGGSHFGADRPGGRETAADEWLTHTTAVVVPPDDEVPGPSSPPGRREVSAGDGGRPGHPRVAALGGRPDAAARERPAPAADPAPEGPAEAGEPLDPGFVVDRLASVGVASMGLPWRIEELRRTGGTLTATVTVIAEEPRRPGDARTTTVATAPGETPCSPTWAGVLDAAFSVASVALPGPVRLRMPAHVGHAVLTGEPPSRAVIEVRPAGTDLAPGHGAGAASAADPGAATVVGSVTGSGDGTDAVVDVGINDERGVPIARLLGLRFGEPDAGPYPGPHGDAEDRGGVGDPAGLVHEVAWHPLEVTDRGLPRTVLLAGADPALREALDACLSGAGSSLEVAADPDDLVRRAGRLSAADAVVLAPPPSPYGPDPAASPYGLDPAAWSYGSGSVASPYGPGRSASCDLDPAEAAARHALLLTGTARLLAATVPVGGPRLWCVTRGAREARDEAALAQTSLWGLGRVVAGEHPDLWGGLADLPAEPGRDDVATLVRLLGGRWDEDVIGVDRGTATTTRLVPAAPAGAASGVRCRADGTYVVTGGTGALGLRVARRLAERGARRLVLVGRTPLPPRGRWDGDGHPAVAVIRSLEATGVTVRTIAADVADHDWMADLLAPDALGMPAVRGVVHAAGVVDDRLLRDLDGPTIRAVMRPKVAGALTLHDLYPPGSLDFLVLFSSAGQLLRLPGQGAYAAANAFLDGLARHRRCRGARDTVSVAWTSWNGLGMSVSSAVTDAELRVRGTAGITAGEALRAWDHAGPRAAGNLAVLRVLPGGARAGRPRVLAAIPDAAASDATGPAGPAADGSGAGTGAGLSWRDLDGPELRAFLLAETGRAAAETLRAEPGALDPHRPLAELGVDSLLATLLRSRLQERLGLTLPATLLWNRPAISDIADYLAELRAADSSLP